MPRASAPTRKHILDTAYVLFSRKGFTRVGVDEIAAAAKITKRTLYYHFRSKDALLAAVFESQHELASAAFRRFGDRLRGNRREIVDSLFAQLAEWLAQPRWAGSGFTRIAMELADLPGHPGRAIARRHKAAQEKHMADLLQTAGVTAPRDRAREVWLLLEGAMAMTLIHGDRSYVKAAAQAAQRLIREARPSPSHRQRLD